MHVLLIAGGWSEEREVSLSGAAKIESALRELGHAVTRLDPSESFDELAEQASRHDFAFLNLHGLPGEDGIIQAILEQAGCPYQGSGPKGSMLALDKAATKQLARRAGVNTPDWVLLPTAPPPEWTCPIAFPLFVKPNHGGSSLGMRKVDDPAELHEAVRGCLAHQGQGLAVLLEQAVPGDELTCGVLGDEPLPAILIRPHDSSYFDYRNKYAADGAEEICPAPIPAELEAALRRDAHTVHRLLGLAGYSRSDFIVADGTPWFLEVNTLPGMTPTSLVPRSAAVVGLDFAALVARLMDLGLEAHRLRQPGDVS